MRGVWVVGACMLAVPACGAPPGSMQIGTEAKPRPAPPDYAAICGAIASDVEALHAQYPQLADYRASSASGCELSYQHHTHRPTHAGGWTAAVPNPDLDGIWFHISIWDPNDAAEASSQLHTQPITPPWWIGERRVTFLILEGDHTTHVADAIVAILKHYDMTER